MGDLSKHFSRSEFACKCGCGFDTVDAELIKALEGLRVHFDSPATINSGCRCKRQNSKVGGAANSQHLKGRAADVRLSGISPDDVAEHLLRQYPDKYGIGRYYGFTHIDSRSEMARWNKR